VPTGWPAGVHPPGSPEFEQTAVSWLLDVVPPDYRLHGVLVRHPVALAALAAHHLAACVEGARQGYRSARAELGKYLPPGGMAAVLAAYQTEGRRLVATARAVDLVGRALRGETFVPQLAGAPDSSRAASQTTRAASRKTTTARQATNTTARQSADAAGPQTANPAARRNATAPNGLAMPSRSPARTRG
jgi:hypothetical protein